MDDTVVIGLYRHGLTVDNERKAYSGWTDSILSEEGKKELKRIQPCLPAYEKVVTSDLQRCVHTAGLLFPEHSTEAWPEFREMNFGRWEGKMHKEAESIEEYRVWVNDPFSHPIPEGESFQEFAARIENGWYKWLDELKEQRIQRAALVTHGGVIRYLLTQFAGEKKAFWEWQAENGRGYELTSSLSALRRGERCSSLQAVPLMAKSNG
ncbi:histidine phosphatase family protein [Bacillus thermotolerans]|uniref:Alpha-ribazole-5'-phosphate phosphatase n=1 Tax=Bacillus thermotolerans TaxID=1221996 RepID=A0A0F5I4V0_BACTR|nr:histidine phosphatase family protein [Bacillus thermotolerans]KKB36025.1 Alpha-ribazole-5'-phosphate phosphatase [Bacillus thermotolerans]KKB40152.1 Alpha-ribazole-5'-phosphate phosphatase [Bacillus thermotolerans]